jgi:molybdate/tungstate transport system substrate-binding protein
MSRPDVRTGLADPLIDSLAYRSLMSVQLAQDYYHDSTIFERLISSELTRPVTVEQAGGIATIHIPEVFKPASDRIIVRSYSLQILALLESGNVDYSFEYESVARQHGLRFLALPAEINLSAPEYAAQYQQVRVTMDFQRFASVVPEFTGGPITYAITIPENAPHLQEAIDYITFLLGPEGQRRLTTNYQPALSPAVADHPERVPNALASILR